MRLVRPTWVFLTIFFILVYFVSEILSRDYLFSLSTVIKSYLLLDGIGYVWVIGVFLGVALLNPIILKISESIDQNKYYFFFLLIIYFGYLGLVYLQRFFSGFLNILYEHVILYTISYGIIAAIGVRSKKIDKKEMIIISVFSFIIYFLIGYSQSFPPTQIAKYPPTTYYLSFAVGMIFLVRLLLSHTFIYNLCDKKFTHFVSTNSMWIYLWHIIPIFGISLVPERISIIDNNFILQFILVFSFSIVATFIQNELLKRIKSLR
ncbi:acyltransferase family protein [Aerococcus urinaeequi]|uniref:acyltransferase family protein n=1 Tax=Aerococcus urinaeequi TaxID=51665 RepID=UPI003D6B9911